jgi:hypothetical protein
MMENRFKFRGQRIDTKEWVYGFYHESIVNMQTRCFIISLLKTVEVIPETVGEYTGLQDIKDQQIYEGDICINSAATWEMIFNKGCFCGKMIKPTRHENDIYLALRGIRGLIKIGNIHENPLILNY